MVEFNPGALSRVVPAHRVTIRFNWCKRDFMLFGFYRAAREKLRLDVQKHCYWCRVPFKDEDMMALAGPEKGANKLLCQTCAGQMATDPTNGDRP